jgi:hypothetical protein
MVGRLSPDGAFLVDADAVGAEAIGPGAPVGKFGQRQVASHLTGGTVCGDECDDPGVGLGASGELEIDAVDVDVAAAVNDDLVPKVGKPGEVAGDCEVRVRSPADPRIRPRARRRVGNGADLGRCLRGDRRVPDRACAPVVAALAAFAAAALWFALLPPPSSVITQVPPIAAIFLAAALALGTLIMLRRWSRAHGWGDRRRLALISGALTASMAAGFLTNHFAATDLLGKVILNLAALMGLLLLHRRLRDRDNARQAQSD